MRAIFLLLTITTLAMPAGAYHCTAPTTSAPDASTCVAGVEPCYYLDNDLCQPTCGTFWIYQESNGIPGLQRGDEVVDDTCHGAIRADTIIF